MAANKLNDETLWRAIKIIINDPHKNIVDDTIIDRFISSFNINNYVISNRDSFICDMAQLINEDYFKQMNQNAAFRIAALAIVSSSSADHLNEPTKLLIDAITNRTSEILRSTNLSSIYGFLEALTYMVQSFPVLATLMKMKFDIKLSNNPDLEVKDFVTLVHYFLNYKRSHHIITKARELYRKLICIPIDVKWDYYDDDPLNPERYVDKLQALVELSIKESSINALLEIKSILTTRSINKLKDMIDIERYVTVYSLEQSLVANLYDFLFRQDLHINDLVVYCQCLALTSIETNKDELLLYALDYYKNTTLKPIAAYFIAKGYPKHISEEGNWSKYILYPLLSMTEHNDMIAHLNLNTAERALVDKLIDKSSILFILNEIARLNGKICDLKMLKKIIDIMSCYIKSNMNRNTHHREVMESIRVLHHMCHLYNSFPKEATHNELRYLVSIMADLGGQMTNDLFLFQIFKGFRILIESANRLNLVSPLDAMKSMDRPPEATELVSDAVVSNQFICLILKFLTGGLKSLNSVSLLGETLSLLAVYIETTGFATISGKAVLSEIIVSEVWPFICEMNNGYLMAPYLSIMAAMDAENVDLTRFGIAQFKHIPYLLIHHLHDMDSSCELRERILTLLTVPTSSSKSGYLSDILSVEIGPENDFIIDNILFGTCLSVRLGISSACLKMADNIMTQIIEHFMQRKDFENNVERLVKTNFITTLYEIFSSPCRSAYQNQGIFINSCNKIESFLARDKQLETLSKALLKYWPKTVINDCETRSTISRDIVFKEMNLNTFDDPNGFHVSNEPTEQVYGLTSSESKALSILDICKNGLQLPEITVSKETTIEDVLVWFTSDMKSDLLRLLGDVTDKENEQWFIERAVTMDVIACEEKTLDCPEMECY